MELESYLNENGLTQEQFAVMIGVTQAAVSRWCNGSRVPDPEHMKIIHEKTEGRVTANIWLGIH